MKDLKEFVISFIGLKEGEHRFEYQIDSTFFDAFNYDEYEKASIVVDLVFVKKTTMLELNFSYQGTVEVPCDLTGELFDLKTKGNLSLIVKFGEVFNNDNEEILVVPYSEHRITVAQYIYEMVALGVPLKRISPFAQDKERNAAILDQLEELKIKETPNEITDPRWGKLKELLIDKNHHHGTSKEKDI